MGKLHCELFLAGEWKYGLASTAYMNDFDDIQKTTEFYWEADY